VLTQPPKTLKTATEAIFIFFPASQQNSGVAQFQACYSVRDAAANTTISK